MSEPTDTDYLPDDVKAIIDVAMAASGTVPEALEPGAIYPVVLPAAGRLELVDLTPDKYLDAPKRKQAKPVVRDAPSFNAYWSKHNMPESEVYADLDARTVTAIFDAHAQSSEDGEFHGTAGWREHVLTLRVRETDEWKLWVSNDGKLIDQQSFAELIEDRVIDITSEYGGPDGATMLELAQSFQATITAEFEQAQQLSNSERRFVFKESIDAAAGKRGEIVIPTIFDLGLAPFEGSDAFRVTARFRYRIQDGRLRIGYKLDRPEDVLREAFNSVLTVIEDHVARPVLRGTASLS